MAVTFKNLFVGSLLFFTLSLIISDESETENDWFKSYKETVVKFSKSAGTGANIYGILSFENDGQVFSFPLKMDSLSHFYTNMTVSVDSQDDVPFSQFADDLNRSMFTGYMRTTCCRYFAIVKMTKDRLDAVIKSENETFYLEPCQKLIQNVCLNNVNMRKTAKNETRHYNNIFYRSNDVNLHKLKGSKIDFGGKIFHESAEQDSYPDKIRKINKRAMTTGTDCTIHLVADHTYYKNAGNSDLLTTIMEMSYLVFQTNLIFRGTDFDGDGAGDNIGFHISKITVYTNSNYPMASALDVGSYLDIFSEYDFSDYCIGSAFSSRDFEDGIIGLAWVADSNPYGPIGGICQRRITYNNKRLSLNTNLVTNVNAGQRMPVYVTALTYAHEMGHSFGSPHDNLQNSKCVPNNIYGNFLMFPYASNGDLPNNNVFSSCSINYIYPVLRNKAGCFKDSMQAVCGNGIIETGEECDCGNSNTCSSLDKCCTPSDISNFDADKPCTYRRSGGSHCSPRKSHCCTSECKIVDSNVNKVCNVGSDCKLVSVCNGVSAQCPESVAMDDTTPCSKGTKSCLGGVCVGSVCATIGLNSCTCVGTLSCFECCMNSTTCEPYLNNFRQKLALTVGTSCLDRLGFCDGGGHCISLDNASTLDRLSHVFTSEQAENFKDWLKDHWYYVVLAVVTITFLVIVFLKTCRGDKNVQTEAYMVGRYSRIQAEAEIQKHYLQRRREKVQAQFMNKIQQIRDNRVIMDLPTAIARMMVFFPTTPMDIIVNTLKQSASEESAVRLLILRKYPFRRVEKLNQIGNDSKKV